MSGQSQPLRPYQAQALAEMRERYRAGKRRPCIVLPTGGGKTRIAVEIARGALAKGGHVLTLAHRTELIDQMANRLRAEGVDRVGVIAAGRQVINAGMQVASLQTLAARADRGLPSAEVVIFDECHHGPASSWLEVAQGIKTRAGGAPLIVGLTATPSRSDGKGLGDLFDSLIQVSSVRELQALGVLVPCVTYAPAGPTKHLSQDPVAAYLSRAPGERAFVFVLTVAQAEMLAISFCSQGVRAATIHEGTDPALRKARLEAFQLQHRAPLLAAGYLEEPPLVLVNVYTLTEGVDVPAASCAIMARGCGHPGMMLQCVGRVLRAAPGKTRATFIDLRGVVHKCGLPEADREWSLEGRACADRPKDYEEQLKPCPACEAMVTGWSTDRDGWRICPACRERVAAPAPVEVRPRALHPLGAAAPQEVKNGALVGLCKAAARRGGNRKGWVAHRYRDKFGDWPPYGAAERTLREMGIDPVGPARAPAAEPQPVGEEDADEAFQAYVAEALRCG